MSNIIEQIVGVSIALILREEAKKIFENYPNLDEVFMTSDKQGFVEKEKAENNANYLADKEIRLFKRTDFDFDTPAQGELVEPSVDESVNADKVEGENGEDKTDVDADKTENVENSDADERTNLMALYEDKFGKKAPHNIGLEKLKKALEN